MIVHSDLLIAVDESSIISRMSVSARNQTWQHLLTPISGAISTIMRVYRLHSFQKPELNCGHIASLQQYRVDGDKACHFIWIKLCISLSHISTHGLPNNDMAL